MQEGWTLPSLVIDITIPLYVRVTEKEGSVILEEILRAVAELNDEERQFLRHYINQVPEKASLLTP